MLHKGRRRVKKKGNKIDIQNVEDGVYLGDAETSLVKVEVEVTVEDHQISDIKIIKHENGKGEPAEAITLDMIENNTSEVDTVTGATMSSKVIMAAVTSALEKGIK